MLYFPALEAEHLKEVLAGPYGLKVIATAILLLLLFAFRAVSLSRITTLGMQPEHTRRWLAQLRNISLLIMALGLLIIWGDELRGLAISVVAFLAALVLALKELITCVTGSALRVGSHSFRIGDRIEIDGIRGEVFDHNLITTTLLEIGPGTKSHQRTGRLIVLPNSTFLTKPVFNESFTNDFVLHIFHFPLDRKADWKKAEAALLKAADAACSDYIEEARKHFEKFEREKGLDASNADPKVTVQFPSSDDLELLVRLAVPAHRRGRIEQAILRDVAEQLDNFEGVNQKDAS